MVLYLSVWLYGTSKKNDRPSDLHRLPSSNTSTSNKCDSSVIRLRELLSSYITFFTCCFLCLGVYRNGWICMEIRCNSMLVYIMCRYRRVGALFYNSLSLYLQLYNYYYIYIYISTTYSISLYRMHYTTIYRL